MEGTGGATKITTKGGTLQMVATVTPENASNKSVTWDFDDNETDTGSATMDTITGLLKAKGNGTVTVRATAKDGSGVVGKAVITISGQEEILKSTATVTLDGETDHSNDKYGNTLTLGEDLKVTGTLKYHETDPTGLGFADYDHHFLVFKIAGLPDEGAEVTIKGKTEGQPSETKYTFTSDSDVVIWGVEANEDIEITVNYGGEYAPMVYTLDLSGVTLAEKEVVVPEVTGSITAFGEGATVGGDKVTFANVKIPWYEADETVGRNVAGNRVGVKIVAPAGFTAEDLGENKVSVVIGEKTYDWSVIQDGEFYFEWWPLITKTETQELTAVVTWNEKSVQTFTIAIAEGATLEAAPVEEVFGSITRGDNTGGADLVWNTDEKDTVTFTEGEIKWYEADPSVSRDVDGNWVCVKITAPKGYTAEDLSNVDVKIGDSTYKWSEIQDGEFYFLWYPLITEGKSEYTATVEWNTVSSQTFKVVIGEDVTLESAPVEPIAADVDYNAVWNGDRGTWYIKVSVPDNDLDANSVKSITVIKEAGVEVTEPVALQPDTDKVMWFGVAEADGNTSLKTAGEYAYEVVRKDGTKYIFNFTYAPGSVTGATNLVQTALDAVNNASSADNYAAVKTALEENAAKLGLDLTEYEKLTPVGRQNAVANDIFNNKPEGGYTIETLKPMFDEIVATRMVFQESVAIFAAASTENPLTDLSYITMLQNNLNAVTLQKVHSGKNIKTDILLELNKLVEDFGNLTGAQKTAVLAAIDYNKNTSSTATRNALRAALDAQVAIDARLTITSVSIADNKAYASTAAGEGKTVRVLGYGVGINLNDDSSGKKVSNTTSIVVELYQGETLLGQQTFKGFEKHKDASSISGTIDAGGQYVATSWDNSWSAKIDQIPDKAVATVKYSDGTATAEKTFTFTDKQTKIFYAAEAVHSLFKNVFAEELALADGVTQDTINAAQTLVSEVTQNPDENKAALQELIDKAWTLHGATKVTDESSLTSALGTGGIIVLGNDISLSNTANIAKDATIIGNGNMISGAFFNVQSGNAVFDNVKFQGTGSSGNQDAIQVRSGASTTVKDCDFNGLYRGINAYFGSTITIQNNNFTDVYRCIIAGMGPAGDNANVSVTDISGNTFNLGFEHKHNSTGKYARGVSYNTDSAQGKGSLSEAVSHMLDNNTFTGDSNVDLDHKVRFYSGYQNYVNQPITDGTSDNVTVVNGTASEVIPSDKQRELVLGKITVTVSESGMTATELSNKLTKADFVEGITVNDSSGNETIADGGRVYVKSKDGKDTNYYIVKIENAEANA